MPDAKYTGQHPRERARWAPLVNAGGVCCARCGRPIVAGKILQGSRWLSNWHLDHLGPNPSRPSHWRCNTAAGGRKAGRRPGRRRPRPFMPLSTRW